MMKKYILALFVVASFVIYSLHGRQENAAMTIEPKSLPMNTSSTSQKSSIPTAGNSAGSGSAVTTSQYKDGSYTGDSANAYYGYIQVKVTIAGSKITDVAFLQYPDDRNTSRAINSQAMPYLKQEAIQAQSSNVDGVSGATDTSQAFVESLTSALQKAQNA